MIILGINAFHADSSAALIKDGQLVAAAEEERFRRIKHWAGFPSEAIKYCLAEAGIGIEEVEHVALNRDPRANLLRKAWFAFRQRPSLSAITDRLKNVAKVRSIAQELAHGLGA